MDGLRPCVFEARHLPRSGTPLPRPEPTPVRHQSYENQQPRQEGNTGRPLAGKQRTKGGTCRPWLIYGRGKAWSKRPNRQAGRHGRKRPPAQPGACARHAGKVRVVRESEKTGLSGRRGKHRCKKQASAVHRGHKTRFQGQRHRQGQGETKKRLCEPLARSAGFAALNLSWSS